MLSNMAHFEQIVTAVSIDIDKNEIKKQNTFSEKHLTTINNS